MPRGATFNVKELKISDSRQLDRRLKQYLKGLEIEDQERYDELYRRLQAHLGYAKANTDRFRTYSHIRIDENGISVPIRVSGKKVSQSTYAPYPY